MKLSKIADKSESKLNQLIKKYKIKIDRLEDLHPTFRDFGIEITNIQLNMIDEKIEEYYNIYFDIIKFRNWKYKYECKEYCFLSHIEGFTQESLEIIRKQYFRSEKMKRLNIEKL